MRYLNRFCTMASILIFILLSICGANLYGEVLKGKILFSGINLSTGEKGSDLYQINLTDRVILKKNITDANKATYLVKLKYAVKSGQMFLFVNESGKIKPKVYSPNNNLAETISIDNGINVEWDNCDISPDGKAITFALPLTGRTNGFGLSFYDIYVYNIENKKLVKVTHNTINNILPAWSPDGKKIAFYSGLSSIRNIDIFPPDTPGYSLKVVNADATDEKEIAPCGILYTAYIKYPPQWSPLGNKIAFDNKYKGDGPAGGMYCIDTNGENLICLLDNAWNPAWSPDGNKIAYHTMMGISVMKSNGKDIVNLTQSRDINHHPIWSPDGKYIAFISNKIYGDKKGIHSSIFAISIDGKSLIPLCPQYATLDNEFFWLDQ